MVSSRIRARRQKISRIKIKRNLKVMIATKIVKKKKKKMMMMMMIMTMMMKKMILNSMMMMTMNI
jgi:hypothetical protein